MKLVYREHPDIEVALGDRPLINNHINAGKEQVEVAAITTNSGILMIMHDNGEYEAVFASEIGAEWVDSEIETQIQDNVSHSKHPTPDDTMKYVKSAMEDAINALEPFAENPGLLDDEAMCHKGLCSKWECGKCSRHIHAYGAMMSLQIMLGKLGE